MRIKGLTFQKVKHPDGATTLAITLRVWKDKFVLNEPRHQTLYDCRDGSTVICPMSECLLSARSGPPLFVPWSANSNMFILTANIRCENVCLPFLEENIAFSKKLLLLSINTSCSLPSSKKPNNFPSQMIASFKRSFLFPLRKIKNYSFIQFKVQFT